MAFTAATFQRIAHGNGNSVFFYKTADAIATVIAADYFNAFSEVLNNGDTIIAVTSTGGTIAVDVLVVSSATAAASVTTTNGT
ncbi:hypothetical protein [Azospirillum sp. sgz301742]